MAAARTLVILGATGDLTQRLLMPALYRLHRQGLTRDLRILGYAMEPWSCARFQSHIDKALRAFVEGFDARAAAGFVKQLDYASGQLTPQDVSAIAARLGPGTLFYLALPPPLFGTAAQALGAAGFAQPPRGGWRRLVVEKPFGTDLHSAEVLRTQMHQHWDEAQVLRIDHFLGKEATQNLMVMRFANRLLEPVWNAQHIAQVQITYAETLGVEHRAAYYDKAGALRDMLQNHLMQLFSLAAMEPLSTWDGEVLRDHKVEVLRAVKPIDHRNLDAHAVRGQYRAGRQGRKTLPAYRREPGVARGSNTETFAALRLEIDNWRWQGVPFYLRSGKRLAAETSEIAVQFRRVPGPLPGLVRADEPNWLVLRIKPEQRMDLQLTAKRPGLQLEGHGVTLTAPYESAGDSGFSAYEQLLIDALAGERAHFLRFDEVEWAWRIVDPVLRAWRHGSPDFYSAGGEGPATQARLLDAGLRWRSIAAGSGDDA